MLVTFQSSRHTGDSNNNAVEPHCPLLAKDSEWVDILQTSTKSSASNSDEEEVLQLVNLTCTLTFPYYISLTKGN